MKRKRRLAFIVPRYEPVSAGGAEVLTQRFAHHLSSAGHHVEVFTTCARDHFTWQNYYEPGRHEQDGVAVERFRVKGRRNVDLFLKYQGLINRQFDLTRNEEFQWIQESVTSPDLVAYLEQRRDDFDAFIFIPYLFGVTFFGIQAVPEKAVLIPCLHDEGYARLAIFREMFSQTMGMIFNTAPEMDLAQRLMGMTPERGRVVGLGFDLDDVYDGEAFHRSFGLEEPFLLYAGRRERGKNVHILMEYFACYKQHNPGELKLVLLGTGDLDIPSGVTDIVDLGYLEEQDKRNAHAAAAVLCQPSVNESLSIVMMESWQAGVPVLVHDRCAVTKDHCVKSGGGLFFSDFFEFEECVNLFMQDGTLRKRMGEAGDRYVRNLYSWGAVQDRFEQALEAFGL